MKRRQEQVIKPAFSPHDMLFPQYSRGHYIRKLFRYILFILAFLVVGAGIIFFIFTPYFQVEHIVISGAHISNPNLIEQETRSLIPRRIAFWDTKNIFLIKNPQSNLLFRFPELAHIDMDRIFPNALHIIVKERIPYVIVCESGTSCMFVDREGIAFAKNIGITSNLELPIIFLHQDASFMLGKSVISQEILAKIIFLERELRDKESVIPEYFIIEAEEGDIIVKTSIGFSILFDASRDLEEQLKAFTLVRMREIKQDMLASLEYIDLRIPNRVYYK